MNRRSLLSSVLAAIAFPFVGRKANAETIREVTIRVNVEKYAATLKSGGVTVILSDVGVNKSTGTRMSDAIVIGHAESKRAFFDCWEQFVSKEPDYDTSRDKEIAQNKIADGHPLKFSVELPTCWRGVRHAMRNCGLKISLIRTWPYMFIEDYNAPRSTITKPSEAVSKDIDGIMKSIAELNYQAKE